MVSVWLDKLFKLPPNEQWKTPVPKSLLTAPVRTFSSAVYIQLLIVRSVFLVTFLVGLLYFVSSVFNVSINLGAFVIAMPSHNFIDFFANDFGKRIPLLLIALSLYYGCVFLNNVPDFDFIFDKWNERGRTDGDAVFNHVIALLMAIVIIFWSFGWPMFLLKGTSPDGVFNNSYLFLFVILAADSLAFCGCVIILITSTLGLCYYFPKYFRKKKRQAEKQQKHSLKSEGE